MWREESGIVEMLFTYMGNYQSFSGWRSWRLILEDILTCHEEVRRERIEFAQKFCHDLDDNMKKGSTDRVDRYGEDSMYEVINPLTMTTEKSVRQTNSVEDSFATDPKNPSNVKEELPYHCDLTNNFDELTFSGANDCHVPVHHQDATALLDRDRGIEEANTTPDKDKVIVDNVSGHENIFDVFRLQSEASIFLKHSPSEAPEITESSTTEDTEKMEESFDKIDKETETECDGTSRIAIIPTFYEHSELMNASPTSQVTKTTKKRTPKRVSCSPKTKRKPSVQNESKKSENSTNDVVPQVEEKRSLPQRASKLRVMPEKPTTRGKRLHFCKFCSIAFPTVVLKTQHEESHTIEQPFVCVYCSKRFSDSGYLVKHELTHASDTGSNAILNNQIESPQSATMAKRRSKLK